MPPLSTIVYVSSAAPAQTEEALEELLFDARRFNQGVGVTGVLLYHGGDFFQYLEGPEDGVDQVYDRILGATRHRLIVRLFQGAIAQRQFPAWVMGFGNAPRSQMLQLSQADWKGRAAKAHRDAEVSDGVGLLVNYWKTIAPFG